MKDELSKKLNQAFPKLYLIPRRPIPLRLKSLPDQDPAETYKFYFETGDGWFDLIWEVSAKIERLNDLILDSEDHIVASQVKEKFGTLRFYTGPILGQYAEEVQAAVTHAENRSKVTCEACGQPGTLCGDRGWIYTSCASCNEKRLARNG